jgi:hypothetical protein
MKFIYENLLTKYYIHTALYHTDLDLQHDDHNDLPALRAWIVQPIFYGFVVQTTHLLIHEYHHSS